MSDQLITTGMKDLEKLLDRTTNILSKLSRYPLLNLENCLSTDLRIGSRSFFWMVYALYELSIGRQIINLSDATLLRLNNYFMKHYPYKGQIKRKTDPFWFISSSQAFSILWQINTFLKRDVSAELLRDGISEYQQTTYQLQNIIDSTQKEQWHDWYLSFWAALSYDWLPTKENETSVIDLSLFLQESQARLEKQLVLHQVGAGGFNQLELAMAARILWSRNTASNSEEAKIVELEIDKAVSVCCARSSRLIEKRLVRVTRDYGELHNLPWEDLFVLLDLPAHIFPDELHVFGEILGYIEARFVEVCQGRERITALTEESSPSFPEPASYFTNYAIVFLARIERLLRDRIRDQFIKNISAINPSHIIDISDKPEASGWESIYETQERTFGVLQEKFSLDWNALRLRWNELNTMLVFGPTHLERSILMEVLLRHLNSYNPKSPSPSVAVQNKWVGVILVPGNFLVADSFGDILNTISDIFSVLTKIDHCIFLVEDAEELLQTRTNEEQRLERILTAATLLNLKKLERGKSIYIFSTNDIRRIDAAATRKGRFAIRKGLGWIHDDEIQRVVANLFPSVTKNMKFLLSRNLSYKSIEEIMDIKYELETRFDLTKLTEAEVESYFKQSWKTYFSDEVVQQHIENCNNYDDHFQRKH